MLVLRGHVCQQKLYFYSRPYHYFYGIIPFNSFPCSCHFIYKSFFILTITPTYFQHHDPLRFTIIYTHSYLLGLVIYYLLWIFLLFNYCSVFICYQYSFISAISISPYFLIIILWFTLFTF